MISLKLDTEGISSDQDICESCEGTGYGECSPYGPEPCFTCGGNGKKRDWFDYYDRLDKDSWIC